MCHGRLSLWRGNHIVTTLNLTCKGTSGITGSMMGFVWFSGFPTQVRIRLGIKRVIPNRFAAKGEAAARVLLLPVTAATHARSGPQAKES